MKKVTVRLPGIDWDYEGYQMRGRYLIHRSGNGGPWRVTDIPSGVILVNPCKTRTSAVEVVNQLAKTLGDLPVRTPEGEIDQEAVVIVNAALESIQAAQGAPAMDEHPDSGRDVPSPPFAPAPRPAHIPILTGFLMKPQHIQEALEWLEDAASHLAMCDLKDAADRILVLHADLKEEILKERERVQAIDEATRAHRWREATSGLAHIQDRGVHRRVSSIVMSRMLGHLPQGQGVSDE